MRVNEAFVLREVGGEYLFVPTGAEGSGVVLVTNGVGAAIWKLYREQPDFEYVLTRLKERFDADEATLREDLTAFTALLSEKKLLLAD